MGVNWLGPMYICFIWLCSLEMGVMWQYIMRLELKWLAHMELSTTSVRFKCLHPIHIDIR